MMCVYFVFKIYINKQPTNALNVKNKYINIVGKNKYPITNYYVYIAIMIVDIN